MTIRHVNFEKQTSFLGRNGMFLMSGIEIWDQAGIDQVSLHPITSQGKTGRAWLSIPLCAIDQFIDVLLTIKEGRKMNNEASANTKS